nr:MAG TPA: hypothetical protein [Bacteriophage sp.]
MRVILGFAFFNLLIMEIKYIYIENQKLIIITSSEEIA